jgi:hypothetical protein
MVKYHSGGNALITTDSAATEQKGVHSGKDVPPPKQPLNLSEVGTLQIYIGMVLLMVLVECKPRGPVPERI